MGTCWLSHAWMLKNMFQEQVLSIDRFHIESSSRAHYSESHDVGTWVGMISRICARISNTLPLRREDNPEILSLFGFFDPSSRQREPRGCSDLGPGARAQACSVYFLRTPFIFILFFLGGWHGRCFEPSGLISFGGCGGVLGFGERGRGLMGFIGFGSM